MRRTLSLLGLAVILPATFLFVNGTAFGSGAATATTAAASSITTTGATLNGSVNPNGQATTYAFQWGLTTSYGNEAPTPAASAGSGSTAVSESLGIGGLTSGTVYHYRVIATDAGGTTAGADQTFTTAGTAPSPATVTTSAATSVTANSATLNGAVVPGSSPTSCAFAYGPTTTYGSMTSAQPVAAGTTSVAMTATISGLASATAFHYQLVCSNSTSTVAGTDQTLTTLPAPGRIAIAGRRLFISPKGVVGVFVACFGGSTCSGTLSFKSGSTMIAPSAHYSFSGEKETVVFSRLTRSALALLKARHTLSTTVMAVDTDGSKSTIPFKLYRELF